jgi:hypothetical protein
MVAFHSPGSAPVNLKCTTALTSLEAPAAKAAGIFSIISETFGVILILLFPYL